MGGGSDYVDIFPGPPVFGQKGSDYVGGGSDYEAGRIKGGFIYYNLH